MNKLTSSFYNHVAQTSDVPIGLEVDYAEGPFIFTTDGKRYVDFISGIAVNNLGHRHPAVVQAVKEQVDKHLHVMVYGEYIQKPQAEYAQLLTDQLPEQLNQVYFTNSGTEAVEGALKLAKKHTGRHKLVAFNGGFHGDTHGSLSVTGRDVYRDPYKPLLPDVHFLNFNDKSELETIDEETAAVILEPIQGEGGIIAADKNWLQAVRRRCDETNTLLIFDEIQTGFYRTGSLFAFQRYGVIPDILCLAKAIAGGMPMGAFVSSSKIFEGFKKDPALNHVTTFGGHPVSAAAALATLNELLKGNFQKKVAVIEKTARKILRSDEIVEIRGRGAMLGMQLKNKEAAQQVVERSLEQGIILGWTLHSDTLIRLAPPLIIKRRLLKQTLKTIVETINEA